MANITATLSVLKFPTADGAEKTLHVIENLSKQQLITLQDGAIVTWPPGKKKPKTTQLRSFTGVAALGGAFWGMLFGLIFLVPLFGMAVGAAMGALAGSMAPGGIDEDFIKKVRASVTEGTSALFLLTSGGTVDKVVDALKGIEFDLVSTNLSKEEEDKLREVFAEED